VSNDWLIRGTAWLAFALYVAAEVKKSRWLNSLGCAALLYHIAAAFQFRHGWSHSAAYADTARQTAALTGWNWGGGIYINYLFALVWGCEVARAWVSPRTVAPSRTWILRGFFLFMFLNAAVVFAHGWVRWLGLLGCVALIAVWLSPPHAFSTRS
jgi:hypothetical protein